MIVAFIIWIFTNIFGIIYEIFSFCLDEEDELANITLLNDDLNWVGRIVLFLLVLILFTIPMTFVGLFGLFK